MLIFCFNAACRIGLWERKHLNCILVKYSVYCYLANCCNKHITYENEVLRIGKMSHTLRKRNLFIYLSVRDVHKK